MLRPGCLQHMRVLAFAVLHLSLDALLVGKRSTTLCLHAIHSGASTTQLPVEGCVVLHWLTFVLTVQFVFGCYAIVAKHDVIYLQLCVHLWAPSYAQVFCDNRLRLHLYFSMNRLFLPNFVHPVNERLAQSWMEQYFGRTFSYSKF